MRQCFLPFQPAASWNPFLSSPIWRWPFVKMVLGCPLLHIDSIPLLCNSHLSEKASTLKTPPPTPVDCELPKGGWSLYPPQSRTADYKKRMLIKQLSEWKEIISAGYTFKGRCKWVLASDCFAEQCLLMWFQYDFLRLPRTTAWQ